MARLCHTWRGIDSISRGSGQLKTFFVYLTVVIEESERENGQTLPTGGQRPYLMIKVYSMPTPSVIPINQPATVRAVLDDITVGGNLGCGTNRWELNPKLKGTTLSDANDDVQHGPGCPGRVQRESVCCICVCETEKRDLCPGETTGHQKVFPPLSYGPYWRSALGVSVK